MWTNRLKEIKNGLMSAENYLRGDLDAICDENMRKYAEETLKKVNASLEAIERMVNDEGKLTIYNMVVERNDQYGIMATSILFKNKEEALKQMKEEGDDFIEEQGKDAIRNIDNRDDSLHIYTDDWSIYITLEECVL